MSAIEVIDIRKRFGDFTAVDGVSFAVQPGEVFGLLGPNGAGKSTLIRMLTTLLTPTSGIGRVAGFDVATQADGVRRSIGVIPQAMTSDTELSVEENLIIFSKLYGVPRARRKKLIDELLDAVDLTEWRDKQVMYLSGGMRRRVEIARGLVHEPKIFFLDEPTTGLDPVSRVAVWEMIKKIKEERGLTVLLTTHYMDEADRLCARFAVEAEGVDPEPERDRSQLLVGARRLVGEIEVAAARAIGQQRRPDLPHRHCRWSGHDDGAGGGDGGQRAVGAVAGGQEHHAR
jgi:ABC-2 type transport system ATP-binding protein